MRNVRKLSVLLLLFLWLGCEEAPRKGPGPRTERADTGGPELIPQPSEPAPTATEQMAKTKPPDEDILAAATAAEPAHRPEPPEDEERTVATEVEKTPDQSKPAEAVEAVVAEEMTPTPPTEEGKEAQTAPPEQPVKKEEVEEQETEQPAAPQDTAPPSQAKTQEEPETAPDESQAVLTAKSFAEEMEPTVEDETALEEDEEKVESVEPTAGTKPPATATTPPAAEKPADPAKAAPAVAEEKAKPSTEGKPAEAGQAAAVLWDDFEASNQWGVEAADGPARIGLSTGQCSHGEKALRAEFVATNRTRFELRREVKLDLTLMDAMVLDVYNEAKEPMELSLALRTGPGEKMYETPPVKLAPGWNKDIAFDLRSETFKVAGTGNFDGLFDGRDDVRRVSLLFQEKENLKGAVTIDNVRFTGRIVDGWQQFRPRITRITPNVESVDLYDAVEITVLFEASYESYFDPADISVTSIFAGPDDRRLAVNGFFDGVEEGKPAWRIRFAPLVQGRWEYQVTVKNKMGEDVSETLRIECGERGDSRGFVRRSGRDANYFELDNGEFFYPIGQNVAWSGDYEQYFKKMNEHGENYARVWMCPWNFMLERKPYIGEYDHDVAKKIDDILALAEKYDIYIQLVFDCHGMLKDDFWGDNPYNAANGGPCTAPEDFFVDRDAKKFYRRRLEYIAARWGASTRIFAWELFNEVDLTKYYDEDDVVRWHNDMMAHLARVDPHRHLMTSSSFGKDLLKKLGGVSSLQIIQKHLYTSRIVPTIRESWQENRGFQKPYFVSEFGAHFQPEADIQDVRGVTLHAGLWSAFMTPAAGNAMPWWWDVAIDANDLYGQWSALGAFARGEDRRGKGHKLVSAAIPVTGGKKLEVQGLLCRTELLLWVFDPAVIQNASSPEYTQIPAGTYFWLVGMAEGDYDIEFWDTYTGALIEGLSKRSDLGRLKIVFPEAAKDIACKVKFKGNLVEPALRLQLDEQQEDIRSSDARIPR